jgi:DNA recombination protein RmuC
MDMLVFVLFLVLIATGLIGTLVLFTRRRGDLPLGRAPLDALERRLDQLDRALHEEFRGSRRESAESLAQFTTVLLERIDAFAAALNARMVESAEAAARSLADAAASQDQRWTTCRGELDSLRRALEARVESLREKVDHRLEELQRDNAAKLDQMRQTVDEKLQTTLETRLGESFRQVSERLEQVYRGLGEMQTLATGVGDLKRVLANVKTRGTWGEVQLEALLEQALARDQYDCNVATNELSGERVEFAIRLPGRSGNPDETVWLPVDAKFPLEDYQALLDATDRADAPAIEDAGRRLEGRVRACAKDISTKYINSPHTTDFAIMFLPVEGLYAEILRRPGLGDAVQRDCRVLLAGPTTLWAILSSLQMGFKTLAIERRSSEVWTLLGAVKTEFGKFATVLDRIQKNLHHASTKIDEARKGTRTIERKLTQVQQLPSADAAGLLDGMLLPDEEAEPMGIS